MVKKQTKKQLLETIKNQQLLIDELKKRNTELVQKVNNLAAIDGGLKWCGDVWNSCFPQQKPQEALK